MRSAYVLVGLGTGKKKLLTGTKRRREGGDVEAQLTLGHIFEYAEFPFTKEKIKYRDRVEAAKWYKMAADKNNNPEGAYKYALLALHGTREKMIEQFKKAADLGSAEAMLQLGIENLHSSECFALAEANSWFKKAADAGNVKAMFRLGQNTLKPEEAVQMYKKAAEKGHVRACLEVALCCESGKGVEANQEEALKWLEKALEEASKLEKALEEASKGEDSPEGSPGMKQLVGEIEYNLAIHYSLIVDNVANSQEARGHAQTCAQQWLKSAARHDYGLAQNWLGLCYEKGGLGIKRDDNLACYFFKSAATNNLPVAEFNLGCWWFRMHNLTKAKEYFKQAAGDGYKDAMIMLAERCPHDKGMTQEAWTHYWLTQAGEAGKEKLKQFNEKLDQDKHLRTWTPGELENKLSVVKFLEEIRSKYVEEKVFIQVTTTKGESFELEYSHVLTYKVLEDPQVVGYDPVSHKFKFIKISELQSVERLLKIGTKPQPTQQERGLEYYEGK